MIICMSDLICITSRHLCRRDFLLQIEEIAQAHPKAIILREKDLTQKEYAELAKRVMEVCKKHETVCILHNYVNTARLLGCPAVHLPLPVLRNVSTEEKMCFREIGASCHSVSEALEAQMLGCTYITAGHIFDTDCKKGLPGRGTGFLKEVCRAVDIPVYALGGISKDNYMSVRSTGAAGACIMSGFMHCENVAEFIEETERGIRPGVL